MIACPHCSKPSRASANFCNRCGTPLKGSPMADDPEREYSTDRSYEPKDPGPEDFGMEPEPPPPPSRKLRLVKNTD
jgi:hypothetical protein